VTHNELLDNLRARYRAPAWVFFEEVRASTGYADRSADALAFSLWPSQGLELIGFEVKAYRGDWLREMKNPAKADRVLGYADRIFLVTTEKGMVKREELPPLWGLIEPHGTALRATKQAEKNPQARPLDRHFFASLMRQAHGYIEGELKNADRTKQARKEGFDDAERQCRDDAAREREERQRLENAILTFQEASGVEIGHWNGGRIGEAEPAARRRARDGAGAALHAADRAPGRQHGSGHLEEGGGGGARERGGRGRRRVPGQSHPPPPWENDGVLRRARRGRARG
jgi:hypothetical protein